MMMNEEDSVKKNELFMGKLAFSKLLNGLSVKDSKLTKVHFGDFTVYLAPMMEDLCVAGHKDVIDALETEIEGETNE